MLFMVVQRDSPIDTTSRRQDARAAHVKYLEQNQARIFLAGPMLDDQKDKRLGSFTILSAETVVEVDEYVRNDPFTRAGIFASTEIVTLRAGYFNPEVYASAKEA